MLINLLKYIIDNKNVMSLLFQRNQLCIILVKFNVRLNARDSFQSSLNFHIHSFSLVAHLRVKL